MMNDYNILKKNWKFVENIEKWKQKYNIMVGYSNISYGLFKHL